MFSVVLRPVKENSLPGLHCAHLPFMLAFTNTYSALRRTASNMSTGAPSEYRDLSEGFRTTFGQPTELTMETDSLGSTALGRTCLPADTMIIGP